MKDLPMKTCRFLFNFVSFQRVLLGNIWAALYLLGAAPATAKPLPGYWAKVDRVVDGDTFWAEGTKYRLVGIDTPETQSDPRHGYKCDAERRLGNLATAKAESLLLDRKVWIKPTGRDRYGRTLARVRYTRKDWYGETMMELGLAARWRGKKHDWCAADLPD